MKFLCDSVFFPPLSLLSGKTGVYLNLNFKNFLDALEQKNGLKLSKTNINEKILKGKNFHFIQELDVGA